MKHRARMTLDTLSVELEFQTSGGNLLPETIQALDPALQSVLDGIKPQILLCLANAGFVADACDLGVFEPQLWN